MEGGEVTPKRGAAQSGFDLLEGVLDDAGHLGEHLIVAHLRLNAQGNPKGAPAGELA
jgi:hypothetical protein